ncbi:Ger(x)C family spore germination protein [Cohnella thermotolerans]|uniref:Ger(x)C family spore germination protein n=1 Tax=Cohnella thermotolerans TaxID=329858 RepID=UPI00040B66B9|nr:Ger(x)C family spore germination protein [Cohnella thermotolerans]
MKSIAYPIALALLSGILLPGCWDAKEIQYISYATTLGIDYDDSKQQFVAYVQVLDFSNVAKQSGSVRTTPGTVWVGKGRGRTLQNAMTDLYSTSQEQIFWGHTTAVIYHERLLKANRLQEALDLTNRYRELRYTKWVYATNRPLEDILSVTPFFKQSPLESILHQPKEIYRQRSYLTPLQFQRFVALYNEPAVTASIPILDINKSQWRENEKEHPLLFDKGIYAVYRGKWKAAFSEEDIPGLRWIERETVRVPIDVTVGPGRDASIVILRPKYSVKPRERNGRLAFDIRIAANASINELPQNVDKSTLLALARKSIADDIRQTYRKGLQAKVDLLQLGNALYHKNPRLWRRYFSGDAFPLREDSLAGVYVRLHLRDTGKYKLRFTD